MRWWTTWAVAVCFSCACRSRPLSPRDVVGTWTVTDVRARADCAPAPAPGTLALRADSSFVASGLPAGLVGDERADPCSTTTGKGAWKIASTSDERVQLDFAVLDGAAWPGEYGAQVWVNRGWKRNELYYFFGDPDERLRVRLEQ